MRFTAALFAALVIVAMLGCGTSEKTEAPVPTAQLEAPPDTLAQQAATEEPAGEAPVQQEQPAESGTPGRPPRKGRANPAELPKMWDFSAEWCPPCQELKPIIGELEEEYSDRIAIKTIDVDSEPEMANKFNVKAIPTLVFLDKDGNELSRHTGFFPKDSLVARFRSLGFID